MARDKAGNGIIPKRLPSGGQHQGSGGDPSCAPSQRVHDSRGVRVHFDFERGCDEAKGGARRSSREWEWEGEGEETGVGSLEGEGFAMHPSKAKASQAKSLKAALLGVSDGDSTPMNQVGVFTHAQTES
jgi:hypothetical protein